MIGGGVALSGQGDRITGAVDGGAAGDDADSGNREVLTDGDAGRGGAAVGGGDGDGIGAGTVNGLGGGVAAAVPSERGDVAALSGERDGIDVAVEVVGRGVDAYGRYGGVSRDGLRSRVGATVGGGGRYRVGVGSAHLDGGGVGAGAPLVGGGVALCGQGDGVDVAVERRCRGADANSRYVGVGCDDL